MTPIYSFRAVAAHVLLVASVQLGAAQPGRASFVMARAGSAGLSPRPAGLARSSASSLSNVVLTLNTLAALPGQSVGGLTSGGDGNFYGVTESGGSFNQGAVFQVTPPGELTVLYSFTGGTDGGAPVAALTLGSDGSLYGTASGGGDTSLDPAGAGTVFKITTNGVFTLLYGFTGGGDGDTPAAALALGANNLFYGTTKDGGDEGYGVVFSITPGGSPTTLFSFDFTVTDDGFSFDNGAAPASALALGTNGGFYGTTQSGGANNLGTVFGLAPGGTVATLNSFTTAIGGAGPRQPGPQLVPGPDGNLYGTTFNGGTNNDGTIFQLTPDGTITTIYSFTGGGDGGSPVGGLLVGTDGNFYGTTLYGGAYTAQDPAGRGYGTLFQSTPDGMLTNLYSFTGGADGGFPASSLVQGPDGSFFGTTETTVFNLTLTTLPFIITQPVNQSAAPGATVTLSVVARGSTPLEYQWQFDGTNLAGAVSATLVLTNTSLAQAGYYAVVAGNAGGSTNSDTVLLSVTAPPAITTQPLDQTVPGGGSADFNLAVIGTPPISYQWRFNGTNISGAVGADLPLTNVTLAQGGNYSVVARDSFGAVTSSIAVLNVDNVPPIIVRQPAGQIAGRGQNASFAVTAAGSALLGYQWQTGGTNLPGANGPTLTLSGVEDAQAGAYSVVVTNGFGSVTSSNALLTVVLSPQFLTQPAGGLRTVTAPTNVILSASAAGATPLSYQWMFNGAVLPGATNAALTLTNAAATQSGSYAVTAGNAFGNVTSSPPVLLLVEGAYRTTTLAGRAGLLGTNDGTGASARFSTPFGVAADPAGNVYVADAQNDTIRKITPNGQVTTLAGRGGAPGSSNGVGSAARFNFPQGLAVDAAGNVYVADTDNYTIRKITPAGVVSTIAGLAGAAGSTDGASNGARFQSPTGLALDSSNNLYVADSFNETIRKITPSGIVGTIAGVLRSPASADGASNTAHFNGPQGVAVDSLNNVYVADAGNSTIRKITPAGLVTTVAGRALNTGATDGLTTNARFSDPFGIAVDAAGNLYVADYNNHEIRMITTGGMVTTLAGLSGGPGAGGNVDGLGAAARFSTPEGIAVGGDGAVYVTDTPNQTVRKAFPLASVAAPSFIVQPPSQTAAAGSAVTFTPTLAGSTPFAFEWQFAGRNLASGTGAALSLTNIQAAEAGVYTLVVTNLAGSTTSSNALLTLTAAVQGEIIQPGWAADVFTLSIASQIGHTYTLESKDDLTLSDWTSVAITSGNGSVLTLTDHGAAVATRFYRVVIQ